MYLLGLALLSSSLMALRKVINLQFVQLFSYCRGRYVALFPALSISELKPLIYFLNEGKKCLKQHKTQMVI